MAYSETPDSQKYLCSCTRRAVVNYLADAFARKQERYQQTGLRSSGVYDSIVDDSFPLCIKEEVVTSGTEVNCIIESLMFKERICHRCNLAVPPFDNTQAESYFSRVFGILIRRDLYEIGFESWGAPLRFVQTPEQRELIPPDYAERRRIRDMLRAEYHAGERVPFYQRNHAARGRAWRHIRAEEKFISQCQRNVRLFAENQLRTHYSFPNFGSWLQQETILFLTTRGLFAPAEVIRHAKPAYLDGLELDIWIPARSLAIEFQGAQHSEEFEYLGGEQALARTIERDMRKAALCDKAGVKLIYFYEGANLGEAAIRKKVGCFLI